MIEDVYEPLSRYRDEFRGRFAALAKERLDELVGKSGVDLKANARTSDEAISLFDSARTHGRWKIFHGVVSGIFFGACALSACACFLGELERGIFAACVAGACVALALGILFAVWCRSRGKMQRNAEDAARAKRDEAWAQMAPLNSLFGWDEANRLIEKTVPRLAFDPYFTAARLDALKRLYGLDDSFFDGKSMLFVQSGRINGNPFVFGQYLEMEWGEKTYEGTKTISWTEYERDSNGRRRAVRRTQTLHAYVTKPIPVYSDHKVLVYGNDAAPNLSFSHEPSGLSAKGGFFDSLKKRRRLSDLRKFSRNLEDDSNFTLMANEEFETWFHTKDRDNEVEFRLLFTPVAQTQMLALMKDTEVGYGDDFTFVKSGKVNFLSSVHLDAGCIDTDPSHFAGWDFRVIRKTFADFNSKYFKDVYFSLAPLLAIPLYQQIRTHEDIWREFASGESSSSWEHEAIANYHGESHFAHPECVTRSILKTRVVGREDGASVVSVTASGYKGVNRVAYESVYGGDGRWHDVPVPWVEYLPVSNTGTICVDESEKPCERFASSYAKSAASAFRRSIYSFVRFGVIALCLAVSGQWTAWADNDVNSDDYRSHPDGDGEPALASLTPEEKAKCIRELKRVERRSKKLGIFLNRAKMERMKGNRLALVLASYDRFISILEELPADFVKACRINSVWFSDEIVDMDGNHAGGLATGEGINLPLQFNKGTVYHEMFHKFECCISSSEKEDWLDCNPDEFIYTGSKWAAFGDNTRESKKARERRAKRLAAGKGKRVAEELEKSKRKKDRAREAANKTNETVQAAFMGSYAQTTPLEDRACTFGTMMTMGPAFLDFARKSEHMKQKMEWMVKVTGKYLGKDFWNVHSDITPELGENHDYDRSPGDWPRGTPAELGFDAEKLGLLKKAIEDGKFATSALMIVSGGKVVFEHGDTSSVADITTCWPSMLSLVYGKYVHIGKIDLGATLDALGVSDVGGLVDRERQTTVRDIISSRSCCFHPAANDPPGKEQQKRGRLMPGNEFILNNWDFNVAATIFEKKTGRSFSEAFESDIVHPLAFQDWRGGTMRRSGRFDVSEHLPYEMSMSVRDMARVGVLMLRNGKWKGLQVVPSDWIAESTARVSKFSNGGGFGYMWWVERQSPSEPALKGAFSARGLNAQRIVVLPALDMVVVHRASTRGKRGMKSADFAKLLDMAVDSRRVK